MPTVPGGIAPAPATSEHDVTISADPSGAQGAFCHTCVLDLGTHSGPDAFDQAMTDKKQHDKDVHAA